MGLPNGALPRSSPFLPGWTLCSLSSLFISELPVRHFLVPSFH